MPWPSKITRAFATFERGAEFIVHGNQYHGPYNKVLNTLFPAYSDFIVSPNYLPGNIDAGTAFIVSFEVTLRRHPVFMLEIKPPQHLSLRSTQETADKQIRRRLVDLSGVLHCRLPSHLFFPTISFLQSLRPSQSSTVSAQ
jgi:hypothetical protein